VRLLTKRSHELGHRRHPSIPGTPPVDMVTGGTPPKVTVATLLRGSAATSDPNPAGPMRPLPAGEPAGHTPPPVGPVRGSEPPLPAGHTVQSQVDQVRDPLDGLGDGPDSGVADGGV
jgi:hypothetical protein